MLSILTFYTFDVLKLFLTKLCLPAQRWSCIWDWDFRYIQGGRETGPADGEQGSFTAISQIITRICTLTDLYTLKRIIRPEEKKYFVSEIMSYDS